MQGLGCKNHRHKSHQAIAAMKTAPCLRARLGRLFKLLVGIYLDSKDPVC